MGLPLEELRRRVLADLLGGGDVLNDLLRESRAFRVGRAVQRLVGERGVRKPRIEEEDTLAVFRVRLREHPKELRRLHVDHDVGAVDQRVVGQPRIDESGGLAASRGSRDDDMLDAFLSRQEDRPTKPLDPHAPSFGEWYPG